MPFTKGHPKYLLRHTEETKQKMRGARTPRISIECKECANIFIVPNWKKATAKFCSHSCKSRFTCKKHIAGKKHIEETLKKISSSRIGKPHILTPEGKKSFTEKMSRQNNWKWIEDRTKLVTSKGSEERRSSRYKDWRRQVCNRDKWKCRISNIDCNGRLEVHHILGFTEYPELKYDINNGISLCHFHHPRKRADEINLSPYFQKLVAELK